ncbi:hypothetical protein T439DRAFT_326937 [Meredithblackwellia eburnea MCA 4105]
MAPQKRSSSSTKAASPLAPKPSSPEPKSTTTTTTVTSASTSLPLSQVFPLLPLQAGAIVFSLVQAAQISSSPTTKVTTPNQVIQSLIQDPTNFLIVSVAGVGLVQVWFGTWLRLRKIAFENNGTGTGTGSKERKGFLNTFKELQRDAMKGRMPVRRNKDDTRSEVKRKPIDFSYLGPAALVTLAASVIVHVVAVLLGAPLIKNAQDTYLLSLLVSILAVTPMATVLDPPNEDQYTWIRLLSSFTWNNNLELALLFPALGTFAGCWLGAVPIPLDWDRPWQKWPTTCVLGALAGHAIGTGLGVVVRLWKAMVVVVGDEVSFDEKKSS